MKLTLILDAMPVGVRASLIEEWEEVTGTAKMEPRVRLFDTEEEALAWGRSMASRRTGSACTFSLAVNRSSSSLKNRIRRGTL